jgi:dimethylamine/trimethylamine dehydrogenase
MPEQLERAGIAAVTRIGDALAPGAIVHAVASGHRYARELESTPAATAGAGEASETLPYRRDFPT